MMRFWEDMDARFGVVRRLGRYGAVSIVTSTVVFSVLGILVGVVNAPAGWSTVAATCVGIALSYELNRRWAWQGRSQGRTAGQVVSFTTINLTGLALSTMAVHSAGLAATRHHLTRLVRTGVLESVNIGAWGALWLIQFLILDRFVFRERSAPAGSPPGSSTVARAPTSIDGEHLEVG